MKKAKVNFNLADQDLTLLPHDDKLEKKVLGLIIAIPDTFPIALKYLNAQGLFYNVLHDELWQKIKVLTDLNVRLSVENLSRDYRVKGDRENESYILTLAIIGTWWDNPHNFRMDCLKLNEYWIQRAIHRTGYHLNQEALGIKDPLELLGEASGGLDVIYQHISRMKETTIADAVTDLYKDIITSANAVHGMLGLPSTLSGINQRIKGYRKGNLIVIGASTGEGKTTLEVQDAKNLAEQNHPVGIISMEMSTKELLLMMACDKLGINAGDVMDGKLSQSQQNALSEYMSYLKTLPLKISEQPGLKIGEIKALGRMWKKNDKIEALYIDHIHLAYDDVDHGSNSEQRYTNIANKLKELAKELEIPVIALAQLNRRDKSEKHRPHILQDLKYAGGIEQAADIVLLVYRPFIHGQELDKEGHSTRNNAMIIVAKLRLMDKRDIRCYFNGTRFSDDAGITLLSSKEFNQIAYPVSSQDSKDDVPF